MKKSKQFQSLKAVLVYAKPYKNLVFAVVVWSILLSVFAAARPYLLKQTVDLYIKNLDAKGLLFYIVLMGLVLALEVVSQFFFVYKANHLGQNIVKDIRVQLFDHLLRFKMKYFDKEPVGKLVTRSVSDIENIASIFSQGFFMIVSDVLKMLVILAIMLYMNWKLTFIVLFSMPVLLAATNVFQKKMKLAFEEVRNEVANLNTFIQERLTGMKIVQLFNREAFEYQKFKEINAKHNKAWLKNIFYNSIFFPIADIVTSLSLGIIVWYGSMSILRGEQLTSFGDLFAYTMLIYMLFNPLRQIADKFNVLQMGIIASERVFEVLNQPELIETDGLIENKILKGNITFKNVRFSYLENEEILKKINLQIKTGETIAIVGGTGAGKSTVINLINRFYTLDSGTIFLDEIPIENFKLSTIRSQISVVLQDVFLFADTIFNNITLGDATITKEQVINAAKQIGVHQFIMSLPENYDFNVKERGVMLSSGQRQLLAFLRAYVANPSILILDEATSSVDSYTEELIQNATKILTQNRTSIIIAHRLATVINATKIIVLEHGTIMEEGTHQTLLQKPESIYKKLYEAQFGGGKEVLKK